MKNAIYLGIALSLIVGTPALAAGGEKSKGSTQEPGMAEMSKEKRKAMSDVYKKMSDCLKSNRPMSECNSEMTRKCEEMGATSCPTMGGDMGGTSGMSGMSGGSQSSGTTDSSSTY